MRALPLLLLLFPAALLAQGQDGTPAERNLQIIATLLPGIYDNANQAYFDGRLQRPEEQRQRRGSLRVTAAEQSNAFSFRFAGAAGDASWTAQLMPSSDPDLVAMEIDFEGTSADCRLSWRRDAGQFTGTSDCGLGMQLDPAGLWITDADGSTNRLLRAREFSCYVDIPGVAGGRDEPFDRYPIEAMHDQGGLHWLTTKEDREIGITLRRVRWPMNNEVGAFTRDSLVMYVLERDADGVRTHTYGWTQPDAERIGLNLQWLLVNCFMVSNRDVQPFFE
ncbi:MAG: hypothetical protein QNJ73_06995 [Gammaproteobacteria bacterium]|nr:hypothetical protein [Gammaproteobacteria bacterium]